MPVTFAGASTRVKGWLSSLCLSFGPHAGPVVSSTSISTIVSIPLTTRGTLIFFFGVVSAMAQIPFTAFSSPGNEACGDPLAAMPAANTFG